MTFNDFYLLYIVDHKVTLSLLFFAIIFLVVLPWTYCYYAGILNDVRKNRNFFFRLGFISIMIFEAPRIFWGRLFGF